MDKIETLLRGFINELNTGLKYKIIPAGEESIYNYECNVYNEISLQHELGKYLEKNFVKPRFEYKEDKEKLQQMRKKFRTRL